MGRMLTLVLLVGMAVGGARTKDSPTPPARARETASSGSPSPQACEAALHRAGALVATFQVGFLNLAQGRAVADAGMMSAFASSLKSDAVIAHRLEDRLMACSILEGQKDTKNVSPTGDQFSTFAAALGDITQFGSMYNWTPPEDHAFPPDLATVAPACGPVLASRLPERIEESLGSNHSTPSDSDVQRLSQEADPAEGRGLTICAGQAYRAGYVGAAWRLLRDTHLLDAAELVSAAN